MIKVIDVDGLFDNFISDFVYKNIGKVKPEEIENKIPELYIEFGKTPLKELDGKTPESYYKEGEVGELLNVLKSHINKGVSVSDFLCEALRDSDSEKQIANELKNDNGEEYTLYLMNILSDKNSSISADRYLEFILWDYSMPIRELATELLSQYPEKVLEKILAQFKETNEDKKANLTEILSHAQKDDRVFNILIEEFVKNQDKIPEYASYLSKYGDERALPFLMTAIESDKIDYSDFEELRFAIESLGGTYDKERDFSKDKVKNKIKQSKNTKII